MVTPQPPAQTLVEADISKIATDLPPPIGKRAPQTIRVDLTTVELEGRLAEGTTFGYWTFNGKVPGPFLRVRVGDTVDVRLKNSGDSAMVHSVDFHAATGPGGGAAATQTNPGEENSVKFKALIPGLYVYHCATPMVAHHIANGMYGLILVEPEEGLPPVDREFYVMQGEIYTEAAFGSTAVRSSMSRSCWPSGRNISCLMARSAPCRSYTRWKRKSARRSASSSASAVRILPRRSTSSEKCSTRFTIWAASSVSH